MPVLAADRAWQFFLRGLKGSLWGIFFIPLFLFCGKEEIKRCDFEERALWSEFISYTSVKSSFSYIKENGYSIYLAIQENFIGDPALLDLLRTAEKMGIKIGAWILLSYEEGYWPNEKNAEGFLRAVKKFVQWKEEENFEIERIIVDMEPSYNRMKSLEEAFSRGDISFVLNDLLHSINSSEFSYAKNIFKNLVDWLHHKGIKVMVTTSPFLIDDLYDGDEDISDALDTPVYGIDWDVVSFMVYRSLFKNFIGTMSPYITYSYSESATSFFGERTAIDLGVTGEDYGKKEIEEDLKTLCFLGISKFHIYSLDYISTLPDPSSFLKFQITPEKTSLDMFFSLFRTIIQSIDRGL